MRIVKAFVVLAFIGTDISGPGFGQEAPSELASFDVAAIKPSSHPRTPEGYSYSDQQVVGPGRFRAFNSNLDECIRWAYNVPEYEVSEPDWLKSNSITFDIEATAPAGTPEAQIRLMLRTLLAERFGVTLHRELKITSVYNLVVNKGGPKLQNASLETPGMIEFGRGSIKTAGTTMTRFAVGLSRQLHLPVLDKTALVGVFAIDIKYAPPDSGENSVAPSIFTSIQELGLRLQPAHGEISIIKVDHANATPTPN